MVLQLQGKEVPKVGKQMPLLLEEGGVQKWGKGNLG